MSYSKLTTNDYPLLTKDHRLMTNNFVNFLIPYCFFRLHLTCGLERGLKRKKYCAHLPFIIPPPNKTLL